MPKLKTHSGAKKRFKLTGTKKVRAKKAGLRHNLGNKASKTKRKKRALMLLTRADANMVSRKLLASSKRA